MPLTRYFCDHAWLGGAGTERDVLVTVAGDRFISVELGAPRPADAQHLAGVTLPGFANVHSHAFHRALRGRTESDRGTFWSWRENMYVVAGALTPETYYELARATYAEMALGGVTCVGEFHYLHHQPGGKPYDDPNEMSRALVAAALDAGLRITLFDACYLEGAPGTAVAGVQARFADAGVDAWAERTRSLTLATGALLGAAVHSVRAVPPGAALVVARHAAARGMPLHFHLSEQVGENEACQTAYGKTPTEVLADAGALGVTSTAVHATHLSDGDIALLGGSGTTVCMCPTTERYLADGIGPAGRLEGAGSPIVLGSDSHAVVDLFAEMQGLELDERLATGRRVRWTAAELLAAASAQGHEALGWKGCGRIAAGAPADLVTVSLGSVRLAGWSIDQLVEQVVFGASAADVTQVVASGRTIVGEGRHQLLDDVPAALHRAITALVAS